MNGQQTFQAIDATINGRVSDYMSRHGNTPPQSVLDGVAAALAGAFYGSVGPKELAANLKLAEDACRRARVAAVERSGFVVEEASCECGNRGLTAIPSDEYGRDVFRDLTEGLASGQHTGWEDLTGRCPSCDRKIDYRRMFVVCE